MHRYAIVDAMFDHLGKKPDGGLGQFRSMLQSLIAWKHFDPYYFDKLKKLNCFFAQRGQIEQGRRRIEFFEKCFELFRQVFVGDGNR